MSRSAPDARWYDELRDDHRPSSVRVLLIAESPPDPAAQDRRYFYSPTLDRRDNLYRGVAQAVYGAENNFDVSAKPAVLRRLQADGFWLLDLSEEPVNHLDRADRKQALQQAVPGLIKRAVEASPSLGTIICMAPLHRLLVSPLRSAGLHTLHDEPLPFPMNWLRTEFVDGFRRALTAD